MIRVFVEKREGFDVEARHMLADLRDNLGLTKLTGLRLLVFPLVSAVVLWGVERCWDHGEGEAVMLVTLLCAIGPSATTITQLAQMFRSPESRYVSSINAVTTLLCVVTMPIMILLFQMLPA